MKFFKILGKILEFIRNTLLAFFTLVVLIPIVVILGFLCMKDINQDNDEEK